MKKTLTFPLLLLLLCFGKASAQIDPHFSQYYAYPLWLNPALTGIMDGDVRLTANVKDQWSGVTSGYKTAAFSGDFRASEKVALGLNVIDQQAGSAGYNYLAAYGSFAYQLPLSDDKYQKLNFGVQAGMINRGFNTNNLQLDNQYNSATGGFDPTMQNFESFTKTNAAVFDASAGMFYYNGNPQNTANLFAGISVSHLAQVKDIVATDGINNQIPMRYTAHGGLRIRATEGFDLTPHAIFISQQKNQVFAAGMNMEFKLQSDYSFILGGMYRVNDAAAANLGLHLNSLMIGLSYDYTTSTLQNTVNPQGTYELSISYVIKHRLANRNQICPRL